MLLLHTVDLDKYIVWYDLDLDKYEQLFDSYYFETTAS